METRFKWDRDFYKDERTGMDPVMIGYVVEERHRPGLKPWAAFVYINASYHMAFPAAVCLGFYYEKAEAMYAVQEHFTP